MAVTAVAAASAWDSSTVPWHRVTPLACAEQNPRQLLSGAAEQDRAVAVPSPEHADPVPPHG